MFSEEADTVTDINENDAPEPVSVDAVADSAGDTCHPGLAGLWSGPLQEQCVGVVVPRGTDDLLQLYSKGRHGYFTDGQAVDLQEWSLIKQFKDFGYVTKAKIVYLRF